MAAPAQHRCTSRAAVLSVVLACALALGGCHSIALPIGRSDDASSPPLPLAARARFGAPLGGIVQVRHQAGATGRRNDRSASRRCGDPARHRRAGHRSVYGPGAWRHRESDDCPGPGGDPRQRGDPDAGARPAAADAQCRHERACSPGHAAQQRGPRPRRQCAIPLLRRGRQRDRRRNRDRARHQYFQPARRRLLRPAGRRTAGDRPPIRRAGRPQSHVDGGRRRLPRAGRCPG